MPDETTIEPSYERIPRDADGNPVFLILSDSDQKRYDRIMKSCEAGWRDTSDPWFFAEAQTTTRIYRQTLPDWLDEAAWLLACNRRTAKHARRAHEASIRFARYCIVRDIKAAGDLTDEAAFDEAERIWKNDPTGTGASSSMMGQAYKVVRKDIKHGRVGRYRVPKFQHRK